MKFALSLLTCLLFVSMTLPSTAALPPLDDSRRQEYSSDIFEGEVVRVFHRLNEKKEDYVDRQLVVEIKVTKTSKGDFKADETVYVHCWTIESRPRGWVGPGGQRPVPRKDQSGTFYVRESSPGVYQLLDPNGWDPK